MKKLLLIIACAVLAYGASAQNEVQPRDYIEVNGRAEMEVVPDEIYLSITIDEAATRGRTSLAQTERAMFNALTGLGIDLEKNMVVSDMSSDLQTFIFRSNSVQTSKSYELKVSGAAQLNDVFKALASVGISNATITRVEISNISEVRNQVREKAAKAALESATVLAGALGQKVGRVIFIQDFGFFMRPFTSVMQAKSVSMDVAGQGAAPSLDFQKTKVEQNVQVRFLLE